MALRNPIVVTLNSTTVPAVDEWFGYAILENASTAVTTEILFRDGTSTGTLLWPVQLAASGSEGAMFTDPISVPSGVLHVATTGAITGTVYI